MASTDNPSMSGGPGSTGPSNTPSGGGSTIPPANGAAATSPEHLASCLKSLRAVKSAATQLFSALAQQGKGKENNIDLTNTDTSGVKKDLQESTTEARMQALLDRLMKSVKSLQCEVVALTPVVGGNTQNNLDLLSLDPASDKQHLHLQLRHCYIWLDKVVEYSKSSHSVIGHSHLNRSHMPNQLHATKRRRPATSYNVNVPTVQVDSLISSISNQFQDMTFTLTRPMGANAIVQVTLGRVLRGVITLRGLLIEGVVIRGYNEANTDKHGKMDLFRPSALLVYQRVTDNASAAMLHFCSPYLADLSIRSFFTWLHSFSNLFSEPCTKCGYTMSSNGPPTWREFRTLFPYHQHCRP